ncbi:hypothetical protein [Marinactinospora rubrisoli]|uniref:Glycoside hydrolase family 15 n=1 Tax=Marinactinospora rubrisoli TaxID=2715399 RepID=A0ABW2KHZ4_9ACTN
MRVVTLDGPEHHPPGVLGTRGTAWRPETRLYSDGVVVGADGTPLVVPPGSQVRRISGTALLDPSGAPLEGAAEATPDAVAAARTAFAATRPPARGTRYADMADCALLDLQTLRHPNGALVAAASPYWRYVWPRDTGYAALALSLAGAHDAALDAIHYVARMQEPDGTWQARYLPDGSGRVPDERGIQLDGIGWTLWAAWVWVRTAPRSRGEEALAGFRPMLLAATRAIDAVVDPETGLPRATQDYWEQDVAEPTLGTVAPLLLGARAGADLLGRLGEVAPAGVCAAAARRLRTGLDRYFAPADFPRRPGGGGRDASVAFLLPPFARQTPGTVAAWRRTLDALRLANGGFRPGEEWPDTATAWTPQISLFAMAAASSGDGETARGLLDWLDARRTRLGALPEKVTAEGRPAAVAPLAITAASVLIALAALDGRPLPIPPE